MFFLSWLVFPLVLALLALGAGLLLTRVAGDALPRVLIVPAGLAVLVVAAALCTQLDATAELAGPVLAVIALAGFVAGRHRLRELRPARPWVWPGVAAFLPAGVVAAPVVLTGQPGLTGYGRIVDIAHQLEFAALITSVGRTIPATIDSSFDETTFKMLTAGYPGGSQGTLGGVSALVGIDPAWGYQPFLACVAAILGVSLYVLLRRAIPPSPWRALAAGLAAQPTILYSYTLAGGIKELSAAAALALVGALLATHRPGEGSWRQLVPAGAAIAAAFAVFNLGIIPWLGVLAGTFFVVELATRPKRGRTVLRWAGVVALAGVLSGPAIILAARLAPLAAAGGPPDLGNLAAPVPAWAAVGPWLIADYRFPLAVGQRVDLTYLLIAIVLFFVALGVARVVRQRNVPLLALGASGAIGMAYVVTKAGPWVDLKAYAITAPIAMAFAFAGAAWLGRARRVRWLAPLAAAVIGGSVLLGNALVYQGTTLTPYERFADLQRLGEKYAGQGPSVMPVFSEFGEYFLRRVDVATVVNPPRGRFLIRPGAAPGLQFVRDPDELYRPWLNEHKLLFLRRDPTASRPPSDWKLVERTEFYDVWRQREDAPDVVVHFPLQGRPGERDRAFCRKVGRAVRAAGDEAWVAYSQAASVVQYTAEEGSGPRFWAQAGPDFVAFGPGRLTGSVTLPRSTPYALWLRGSFGREVRVKVDGKEVGSLQWQESYPGQYARVGTVELTAGSHDFEIVRGGGTLLPGTGNEIGGGFTTMIGPLAFDFSEPGPRVRYSPPDEFQELCRAKTGLDWVEVVSPGEPSQR